MRQINFIVKKIIITDSLLSQEIHLFVKMRKIIDTEIIEE